MCTQELHNIAEIQKQMDKEKPGDDNPLRAVNQT